MERILDFGIKEAVVKVTSCVPAASLAALTVPIGLQLVDRTGFCKLVPCHFCLGKLKLLKMPWRLPNSWKLLSEKQKVGISS